MKLNQNKVSIAVCAAMMSVNVATAAQLVTSGDFSHDVVSEGSELLLTGSWTTTGTGGLVNPTVADFDNETSLGNVAVAHSGEVITQDLGVSLELGKLYELSVEIGDGKQSDFGSVMAGFRVNGNYIPLTLTANPADGQLVSATAQLYVNSTHQSLVDSGANIVLELSNSSTNTSSVYFNQVSVNSSLPTGNYPIVHGGNTQIDGALRLAGTGTEPFGCDNSQSGALYFNQAQQQVMICDGTVWSEFKGEQGEKGDTGEQGIQGIQGEKGDTGDKGDTGEQGIQGIQGVAGTTLWTDGASEVSTTVNVGVGTANPSAKLEVVGNAIAHPPVADNHLVTKGFMDAQLSALTASDNNLLTQINNLVGLVNQQRVEIDKLNEKIFPPAPTVFDSCKHLKESAPDIVSGVYKIDPDREGPIAPFDAYCDMEYKGGGWTLVAQRQNYTAIQLVEYVDSLNTVASLKDYKWQALKTISTEFYARGQGSGVGKGPEDTITYSSLPVLESANCKPLSDSLGDNLLMNQENSGCSMTGVDYCMIGHKEARALTLINSYCSKSMHLEKEHWNTSPGHNHNTQPEKIYYYLR